MWAACQGRLLQMVQPARTSVLPRGLTSDNDKADGKIAAACLSDAQWLVVHASTIKMEETG